MIDNQQFTRLVSEEAGALIEKRPDLGRLVTTLVTRLRARISGVRIEGVSDIFDLCPRVDSELAIPDDHKVVVGVARKNIADSLIEALFEQESEVLMAGVGVKHREQKRDLDRRKNLALSVPDVIDLVTKENPETFNQQWIQANDQRLFDRLKRFVVKADTGVEDWEQLKEMLPKHLKDKFVISKRETKDQSLVSAIMAYKDLVKQLGPEAVAEFLISIRAVDDGDFGRLIRVISEYLGRCSFYNPSPGDVAKYPEALLKLTDVRRLLFIKLRNYVYKRLVEDGFEITVAQAGRLETVKAEIAAILGEKMDVSKAEHKALLDDVIGYFDDVLSTKVPERMVETLPHPKTGQPVAFPALRQRIAMREVKDQKRQLISFFMGKGKTATTFLAKEHVGAKKMLYVCPQGELVGEIANRVNKYYKEGQRPNVGIVKPGMDKVALDRALECEVVILPYSLLSSEVEGQKIVEAVKTQPFDMMVVDEVHLAKKEGGRNTNVVYDLATGIPDLYEKGYIVSLSADPTPNTPDDIVPQLRIYDRQTYGETKTLRDAISSGVHPLKIRNALLDYMLLIDDPEEWEKYMKIESVDLYDDEREIYTSILEDETLDPNTKLNLLYMCTLNPQLFAVGKKVKSAVFDRVGAKLDEYLADYNSVLIAENNFKKGILRPHDKFEGSTFVDQLKQRFGSQADIYVIDGDTSQEDREVAFEAARKSESGGRKVVIVAMGDIVRLGINLSHIHRAISLDPTYNKSDTVQFVKRFARENNEDVEVSVVVVNDNIFAGIAEHAEQKDQLTRVLKYGGTLTDDDLAFLESDFSDAIRVEGGKVLIGTAIMNHLLSQREKLFRIFAYLHNRGAEGYQEFIRENGEFFAELYLETWEKSYGGNNGRFVAGLMQKLEIEGVIKGSRFADIGCGPLVLEQTLGAVGDGVDRKIFSRDLNKYMIECGKRVLAKKNPGKEPNFKVGSMHEMSDYPNDNFDVVNCSLALNYTKLNTRRRHAEHDERAKTLAEMNRVMKTGAVAVITLPDSVGTGTERLLFQRVLASHFGFEILPAYTGMAQSTDDQNGHSFKNYTLVCRKVASANVQGLTIDLLKNLQLSRVSAGSGSGAGKKQTPADEKASKNFIHTQFKINATELEFDTGSEAKIEQDTHWEKVAEARVVLQEVFAANSNSFANLSGPLQARLEQADIEVVNYGGGHLFFFKGDPVRPHRLYTME